MITRRTFTRGLISFLRATLFSVAVLVASFLSCAPQHPVFAQGKPKAPAVLNQIGAYPGYDADVIAYDAAVSAGDYGHAKVLRDKILYGIKTGIDGAYGKWESGLLDVRSTAKTITDLTKAALASIIGIASKPGLVLGLSLLETGDRTFEKNFGTAQIVVTNMRAARLRAATNFEENLSLPVVGTDGVEGYPLNKGVDELVGYFYEGTYSNGLNAATQQAGQNFQSATMASQASRGRAINDARQQKARQQNLQNAAPQIPKE